MSQYNSGSISVEQGSQDVFGVYEIPVTNSSGTFVAGDAVTFPTSMAAGIVTAWDSNTDQLKFEITSTDQPIDEESVVSTAATGTIGGFTIRPTFVGNISPGNLFIATDEPVAYEVASVVTRSHFALNSQYQGATLSDAD